MSPCRIMSDNPTVIMGVIFASSPSLLQPCWQGSGYVTSWPQQSRNISVPTYSHGNSFLGGFYLFCFCLLSLRLFLLQRVTGCIYKRQYLAKCTEEHKETLKCTRNQYIYTRFHFWWFQAVHQAKAVFSTLCLSIYKINMYSLQANVYVHILVSPQFTAFLELPLCESRTNVNFILLINPPTFQPCIQTWCNFFFLFKLDRIQTEERICYQQPKMRVFFFTRGVWKARRQSRDGNLLPWKVCKQCYMSVIFYCLVHCVMNLCLYLHVKMPQPNY